MQKIQNLKKFKTIFLDFDGVLTNNKVIVDENGKESVICSRSDGLAIDILKSNRIKLYIISTEKNHVVLKRASKLGIDCYNSIKNKEKKLINIAKENKVNLSESIFIGNDLNDYRAMKVCGLKICPNDSHQAIKNIADYITKKNGGDGVLREVVENFLEIDMISHYSS